MTPAFQHNIGAFVAVATSVLPQSSAAATVDGSSVDRFAHGHALSCVLHQVAGADSGTPTTVSVQTKLQHSADNSTWADYTPPGASSVAETVALTAASTENSVAIDLSSADQYIRAVTTVAFTGGTSPAIEVAADIVLAGEDRLAAA
jgi:hypothetical protein